MNYVKFTRADDGTPVLLNLDKAIGICQDPDYENVRIIDFGHSNYYEVSESIEYIEYVMKCIQEAQDGKVRFY